MTVFALVTDRGFTVSPGIEPDTSEAKKPDTSSAEWAGLSLFLETKWIFFNTIGLKTRIKKAYEKVKTTAQSESVFLAAGMWLPPVPRSVAKIQIQQQGEMPSGQPENQKSTTTIRSLLEI